MSDATITPHRHKCQECGQTLLDAELRAQHDYEQGIIERVFAVIRQVGVSETFMAGDGYLSVAMLNADEIIDKARALLATQPVAKGQEQNDV